MVTKRKKTQPAGAKASLRMPAAEATRTAVREKPSTPARLTRRSSGRQAALFKPESQGSEKTAVKTGSNTKKLLITPKVGPTAGHKKSITPADAYEFSETDDFISSGQSKGKSQQKKSRSMAHKKSTSIAMKKGKAAAGTEGERKKQTSTPVGSQNRKESCTTTQAGNLLGKRRSPRTPPALLDLDISVTPILPVPSVSPKRRRNNNYDPRNDSMTSLLPERKASADFQKPKPQNQKLRRPVPAQVSTPTTVPNALQNRLKRKQPAEPTQSLERVKLNNEKNSAYSAKNSQDVSEEASPKKKAKLQKKWETQTVSASKKIIKGKQTESKPSSVSNNKNLKPKTTTKKPTGLPVSSDKQQKDPNPFNPKAPSTQFSGGRKPSTEQSGGGFESKVVKKAEKEECNLSVSKDSGISFGSEVSSPETSPQSASFPGFMEDEPLFGPPPDLSFSPPPSTNTSAKDPESLLNKTSKSYKASKVKREKGRHSLSRLEAWAEKINEVMEDAESFELVIE